MAGFWKIILVAFIAIKSPGWLSAREPDMPVFKQISHPFMPTMTSEYFYFSEDGLLWFSTTRGLASFDGSEIVYYSTLEQA